MKRLADPSALARRDALIARVHEATRAVLGGRDAALFAERLLALRHVELLAPGVLDLRVAPGTVVTPLARDELKRRGVALVWVGRRDIEAVRAGGEWGFAIEGDSGVLTALRRTWLDGGDAWREFPGLGDAAGWVANAAGRGAVVLTDAGARAAWRANQRTGVRAATADSSTAVSRAVAELGLNLLVIEPAGKPLPLLRQLATTFRAAGAPRVPADLDFGKENPPCGSPR